MTFCVFELKQKGVSEVGIRIRSARNGMELNQSEFARLAGVSVHFISRMEIGVFTRRTPRRSAAEAACLAFIADPPLETIAKTIAARKATLSKNYGGHRHGFMHAPTCEHKSLQSCKGRCVETSG